jgi:hypothetical protein
MLQRAAGEASGEFDIRQLLHRGIVRLMRGLSRRQVLLELFDGNGLACRGGK